MNLQIRPEQPSDIAAISAVTIAAFADHPHSRQTEQFIIHSLRAANVLTLSLVAVVDAKVVGHIAFSPVTISDGSQNWYGLGPISVWPPLQRQGIGKALMHEGLAWLRAHEGQGCVLVGQPEYYQRFGFKNFPDLLLEGVPPQVFLGLSFTAETPHGTVSFHPGFSAKS